jgi:site-specific DNA recombinase
MKTAASAPVLPAAIYARISRDKEGAGLGVERQEADCRALAERLGWEVVAVYVDNDMSASSGKPRPQYQAMLDAVRAGQVRAVLAWHPDRLHRRMVELETFIHLLDSRGVEVRTVTAGDLDLSSATGRMNARIIGAVAQKEAEQTRDRVKRAKDQMAIDGKFRGGMRPYGYEADGVTVREDEAAVIRTTTTAVLAGRSLAAVARDMNEANLTTSTGKAWTYARLRDVLVRPRNAGLLGQGRHDRGEAVIVGAAVWPAIVDEDTWRAVYTLLNDAARRKQDGNGTRWLGSGIYVCGLCGSPMRVAPYGGTAARPHDRRHLYRCVVSAHLTISQRVTDDFVRAAVTEMVRDPRVVATMSEPDPALDEFRGRRTALDASLVRFQTDYEDGHLTATEFRKAKDRAEAELAEVEARIVASVQRSTSSPIVGAFDPGRAFLDAPLDVQRAVLRTVLTVEVAPTPRRGMAWTPERLRLTSVTEQARAAS